MPCLYFSLSLVFRVNPSDSTEIFSMIQTSPKDTAEKCREYIFIKNIITNYQPCFALIDVPNPQNADHVMNSLMFFPGNGESSKVSFPFGTPGHPLPVCTAQDGGGSFKDRKPVRGWLLLLVGRKANEPMDRQAVGGSAMELQL